MDAAETDPRVILEDPLVPSRFQVHPLWNFVRLGSIDATGHDKSRKVWNFQLVYGSEVANELENEDSSFSPSRYVSPFQQRVSWRFGTERVAAKTARKFIEELGHPKYGQYDDNEGHLYPVSNSVGDPYNPAPQRNVKFPIAVVERNQLVVPPEVLTYTETINDDHFRLDGLDIGEGVAYMRDIGVSEVKHDRNFFFRTCKYEIGFKPTKTWKVLRKNEAGGSQPVARTFIVSGWDEAFVDEGFRWLKASTRVNKLVYESLKDGENNAQRTPTHLDGQGKQLVWTDIFPELLNPGLPPDRPTLAQIAEGMVYNRYMFLEPKPFSVFNFH